MLPETDMNPQPADILISLDQRVASILDGCTKCGACVSVCPTPGIDGIEIADSEQITGGVLDILRIGSGPKNSERWSQGCCGSGFCLSVCEHGINPRFMLTMARRALSRAKPLSERKQQENRQAKKQMRLEVLIV